MFKNFYGFHLLEAYQRRKHHEKRNHPERAFKKTVEAIAVVLVTLLLWNLPSDSFGIEGLNVVQQRIIAIFADPVIMLFIGGFILAIAATKTGLDAQLAKVLLKPFGTRSEMMLLGFLLITGLFSMFVSNTATAAMMLTFLTPVFRQLPPEGKGRIALALSIPVAANLVQQKDMARIGIIVGVISMVLGYALLYLIGLMHVL